MRQAHPRQCARRATCSFSRSNTSRSESITDGVDLLADTAEAGDPSPPRALLVADARAATRLASALQARARFRVTVHDGAIAPPPSVERGQYDVIIVDLALPAARAVVEAVRSADAQAAIVIVGPASSRGPIAQLDVDDCIVTDATPAEVERCVEAALERRRLRAQLEASDARFHSIIERNADGILILDAERRIRFVNPAAEQLFGRSAAELTGEVFGWACTAGGTAEIDIVRRGEERGMVAELRVNETTWEGEAAELVMVRDVTDRKQAEEQAQRLVWAQAAREQAEQASRRSRFLVEAGAVLDSSLNIDTTLNNLARLIVPRVADWCVIDLLEDGTMRRVAAVHAHAERQQLLDVLRVRYPPQAGSFQPSVRVMEAGTPELHQGMTPERVRELALDDDHSAILLQLGVRSVMAVPLQARERRLGAISFICGTRDFTDGDLALAEEIGNRAGRALENARLYEAALAANRAKADFLAVMSHELRTPLNAILGYTQLLLEGITGEVKDVQRRHLERVHTSATHLLQIIEEILAFASMEAGRNGVDARPVPLSEIIDAAVSMTEPLARQRGLEFVVETDAADTMLFTDPIKVRQILINLLTNAVKFTDAGSVTLRTELRSEQLIISVADTGTGIEPDAIGTIFEPFRQIERPLTRHAGGTGLGLTVSLRLAQLLGGNIEVQSEVGTGSTFTVTLPIRYSA